MFHYQRHLILITIGYNIIARRIWMFYQANTIANYVLYFCDINDIPISNLKLQKILWFLQLDYLVIRGTPLFVEDFEAWDIGPVVPEVWKTYRIYGGGDIPCDFSEDSKDFVSIAYISEKDKKEMNVLMVQVMKFTPASLEKIVCEQEPFKNNYVRQYYNLIPINDIKTWGISEYGKNAQNPHGI